MKSIYILISAFIISQTVYSQSDIQKLGNGLTIVETGGKYGIKNSSGKTK